MIKVDKLNKYFNKRKQNEIHVINNTTLEFNQNGLVCLLGESGSGKTTLLNTLGGLDSFNSGTIKIDDEVIKKYHSGSVDRIRNKNYGYIFQNYYLLFDRTVLENIVLGLAIYDISDSEKEERADYVLKRLGMYRYKKKLVGELSGGQQQRVAIARALIKSPKVIFADEPTGNLDEKNTIQIMNIIKKLSKDCLIILVTHEIRIAKFYADRIIEIKDGEVIKDYLNEDSKLYKLVEDNDIYLQDYNKTKISDNPDFNLYTNTDLPKIKIDLIYENNTYYINTESNSQVELIDKDSYKSVYDKKRAPLDKDDVEANDYHLEKINKIGKAHLKFKEILRLTKKSLSTTRKKRFFLMVSLFIMAIFSCLTIEDISEVKSVDERTVVESDSRKTCVQSEKNSFINTFEQKVLFEMFFERFNKKFRNIEYTTEVSRVLYLDYSGIEQIEEVKMEIGKFDFLDQKYLSKKSLIYGRMPEKFNEIVIDKWIIENLLDKKYFISNIADGISFFLNKELVLDYTGSKYKIVGICESNNLTIYGNKFTGFSFSNYGDLMTSDEEFKKYFDEGHQIYSITGEKISIPDLAEDEVILSEDYFRRNYNTYQDKFGRILSVKGYFTENIGVDLIVPSSTYDEINKGFLSKLGLVNIINITKEMIDYIENYESSYTKSQYDEFRHGNPNWYDYSNDSAGIAYTSIIVSKNLFDEKMVDYDALVAIKFDARIVVTITIFVISLFILYFTMKSNAMKLIYPIGVYRSIGISKLSIVWLFALELTIISLKTTLIGVFGTFFSLLFISTIPSLGMTVHISLLGSTALFLILLIFNLIIGIVPILKILILPPAQLTSRYDI